MPVRRNGSRKAGIPFYRKEAAQPLGGYSRTARIIGREGNQKGRSANEVSSCWPVSFPPFRRDWQFGVRAAETLFLLPFAGCRGPGATLARVVLAQGVQKPKPESPPCHVPRGLRTCAKSLLFLHRRPSTPPPQPKQVGCSVSRPRPAPTKRNNFKAGSSPARKTRIHLGAVKYGTGQRRDVRTDTPAGRLTAPQSLPQCMRGGPIR